MDAIAVYFPPWVSWTVLAAMSFAAAAAFWRLRKASLIVLLSGVGLTVFGEVLKVAFEDPFHPFYVGSSIVGLVGVATIAVGLSWFVWKDYPRKKR